VPVQAAALLAAVHNSSGRAPQDAHEQQSDSRPAGCVRSRRARVRQGQGGGAPQMSGTHVTGLVSSRRIFQVLGVLGKGCGAPQMSGTHVTGLVSCRRIFQMLVAASAPFMPSSCATLPLTTSPALPAVAAASAPVRRAAAAASLVAASTFSPAAPRGAAARRRPARPPLLLGIGGAAAEQQLQAVLVR
jgi:hypothetical protein